MAFKRWLSLAFGVLLIASILVGNFNHPAFASGGTPVQQRVPMHTWGATAPDTGPSTGIHPLISGCSTAGTNCCPSSLSPSQYLADSCRFSTVWPYSGGKLNLTVSVDGTLPSIQYNGAIQGIANWNNSYTQVHLTQVSSGAQIRIVAWHGGGDCYGSGSWGYTQNSGGAYETSSLVEINIDFSGCNNSGGTGWISTATHELGHALGLNHNNWYDGSTYMVMNSCSGCNASPTKPQSMDTNIIQTLYPYDYYGPPSLSHSCGSSWTSYYDSHAYNSTYSAGLNNWFVPANSSSCNSAHWYPSGLGSYCDDLYYWVAWAYADVTSLTIYIHDSTGGTSTYNLDEQPNWSFIHLGRYYGVTEVDVYDNHASPSGTNFSVGPLKIDTLPGSYC